MTPMDVNMTVWLSKDEGRTWPAKRQIDPGPSAYSDLATLPGGQIVLLYEPGVETGIDCVKFDLDWLTGGAEQGWPKSRIRVILLPSNASGPFARSLSGKALRPWPSNHPPFTASFPRFPLR